MKYIGQYLSGSLSSYSRLYISLTERFIWIALAMEVSLEGFKVLLEITQAWSVMFNLSLTVE